MTSYLAIIALSLALLFLGLQVFWACRFAACYPPPPSSDPTDAEWPRVAVVLSVRGADPSLVACLRQLLRQNYSDYEIHLVIDSEDDPAWELLRPLLAAGGAVPIHVRLLDTKFETCSLKVSALAQAIGGLEGSVRVVALVDADVIPYADWLRDLVRPLREPRVGAATGVRWYLPETSYWGSLVRCLWNSAACTQMLAFRIPWGGSLAFRAELFRASDLLDQWKRSFCEDTVSYGVLRRLGLRVAFVPAATMVNSEHIALKHCFFFIRRQLLTVRLHHPRWPFVLAAGLGAGLALAALVGVLVAAAALGDFVSAGLMMGALAAYAASLAAALWWIDRSLRAMAHQRGEHLPAASSWKLALAGPLTQAVYLAALVSVSFLRRVAWRGITYELYGRTPVHLTRYLPYRLEATRADQSASVI